jgi:hypothetical protein
MSATQASKRQYRIDHGLCPYCGEEAAPYYLCTKHREIGALGRLLDRSVARCILSREKDKGRVYYNKPTGFNPPTAADFEWRDTYFDMKPNDKRRRPRMGKRPVDLDETLIEIFETAGRPLQMHEILEAWGRLRTKRKTSSLAGDMRAIIEAKRHREAKNAKRAALLARGRLASSTP